VSAPWAERAYAVLLRAYPAEFRATYGREMALVFREMMRDRGGAGLSLWVEIVGDVACTAPARHVAALRASWNSDHHVEEGRMKPMGIFAVLIGLLQIVNASLELVAGGSALAAFPVAVVLLAIAVALLLVAAGVALVRRTQHAGALATTAAVAWLILAVITRAVHPWMSIFSLLLAIVFPLVLLAFIWTRRGSRGEGMRTA
jgi:hypothetical protein